MSSEDNNTLGLPVKKETPVIEVASNIHPSPMRFSVSNAYIYGCKNKSSNIYTLEESVSIHGLLRASKATTRVITRVL